jgi:hypothetical protein
MLFYDEERRNFSAAALFMTKRLPANLIHAFL